jgi:hypothetical protein
MGKSFPKKREIDFPPDEVEAKHGSPKDVAS